MTTWPVLLLASVFLGSPGLTLSPPTPEPHGLGPASWCQDPEMAHLCDAEQLCQGLAWDGPQDHQLPKREGLGICCWVCKRIMQKLEDLVGKEPSEETITQAASHVCTKVGPLKGKCKKILKKFLQRISQDIMDGKTSRDICVDLKMCKPRAGLL